MAAIGESASVRTLDRGLTERHGKDVPPQHITARKKWSGRKVIALDRFGQDGLCGDISNMDGLRHTIETVKPDILVNAAAYTSVDKAEDEPELAIRLNAEAPVVMAKAMKALGGCLVHYSTDYVFDGSGTRPWKETDDVGPLSWVYASRGNNFAKTMLRLAKERDTLNVINDQIGAPTGADLIADITAHALRQWQQQPQTGLYHLAASGETSWHQYASFVIQWAQKAGIPLAVETVNPIPSEDYPVPAERPKNSRLDCRLLESTFGLQLPQWQQGVERMLQEIMDKEAQ